MALVRRASRWFNSDYKNRYRKKPGMKGTGIYATGMPGTPNGVHSPRGPKDPPCQCSRCRNSNG